MSYYIESKKYRYFIGNMPGLGGVPHIHSHLELVYLCSGSAVAELDGNQWELEPGDLFLAFPNQIHSYEKREPVNIYLVIFSCDIHPQLQKLISGRIPQCPVLKKDVLPAELSGQLACLARQSRSDSAYEKLEATGGLLTFLGQILPLFSYQEAPGDQDSVKKILSYCTSHYTEPLTLDVLSRELYLSRFYISHIFTKRMGIRFPEFLGKLRVDRACSLLLEEVPISQVAFSSGFSSIRTFNRTFRAEKGMTPREYIQSHQKQKN